MLSLRDMRKEDIEDYVRWFTVQIDWGQTDAPWEPFETTADEERKNWTEIFNETQNIPFNQIRQRFEIEVDGVHIGWVSAYQDTEWFPNPDKRYAIGIDIPEGRFRGKGYGTIAFEQFIDYYRKKGHDKLYTQTWSGNVAMIAVAQKLGFVEIGRKADYRLVEGKLYDALTFELKL
ncbi:MAG: GNAT family N-acetyltransferase [Corallococcus sp.]|nr:GNAT family N-acetyltransferase [Corallococcus sp.]MCM1360007.1 GNAT family N-acetyltransferase [Corallococcus sp.]MCM1395564.1 GNAT family N-acetyltransferase [Corallococcus sp.]